MMRLFFWALLPASLTSCMALDSNLSNIREESYKITTNNGISCRSKIPFLLQKYLDESIKISQVTWSGNCKNSELDGQGTLIGLDQNSQRVFQIKGVAKENSQRSYVSQFEQYEFDFLGKQYIGNQANSPIVFFYPSSLTIGDAIINIDDRNKYQGSFIGDPNTKKINYSFGFPYKLINEANKTELAVSLLREDRAIYSGIFKAPPALANIQTGENIPLGTLTQNGKFIACYVDSKKYNSQIECDHQFKKLESDIQNQLVIIDQKKDQEMATERQRLQQKRIEEQERVQQAKEEAQARRQEQWQQLGQVLGTAATVYTAKQTQKANTARYSKPTPTPTYTPSQTSVYTPPAPITQINTPSYNPTPTINYPNSSTKNKVNSSEYEVHNCLSINNNHLQNNCDFPVWVSQCAYKTSYDKKVQLNAFEMGSSFDCEKNIGLDSIAARSKDPARLTGQKIVWFACKKPATPKNTIFDSSRQLITGYCE